MTVWIINQYATSPRQAGITRHYNLAKVLAARGHRVTVIASSFDHFVHMEAHLKPGETSRLEEVDGVPFLWLRTPSYTGNTLGRVWNMLAFAVRLIVDPVLRTLPAPDAIVGSSPHLLAALGAERLAARYRVPFVMEVRDLWPRSLVDIGGVSESNLLVRVLARLERYLYSKASRVVTLVPNTVEHFTSLGVPEQHVAWIPNGVDLATVPEPVRRSQGPLFVVKYAGAHGLSNGLDCVIEAARILQRDGWGERVQIRLVGDGPDKKRLIELASQARLTCIEFDPPVPRQDIYRHLADSDVLLFSLRDSPLFEIGVSPNKLFDYMAVARPVIFAAGTRDNPIRRAGAGICIQPGDGAAIAGAIIQMAGMSQGERDAMGIRGRRYVEDNHSIAALGLKLEQTLLEAVFEGGRGSVRRDPTSA